MRDAETGLYHVRNRMYDVSLGRWLQRDPAGYIDGYNLYAAYFVPGGTDPFGLWFGLLNEMTRFRGRHPVGILRRALDKCECDILERALADGEGVYQKLGRMEQDVCEKVPGKMAEVDRLYHNLMAEWQQANEWHSRAMFHKGVMDGIADQFTMGKSAALALAGGTASVGGAVAKALGATTTAAAAATTAKVIAAFGILQSTHWIYHSLEYGAAINEYRDRRADAERASTAWDAAQDEAYRLERRCGDLKNEGVAMGDLLHELTVMFMECLECEGKR